MLEMLKFVPILLCSLILGRCFFGEVKKAKAAGLPWFAPYVTISGVLVIIALMSPLFVFFFR